MRLRIDFASLLLICVTWMGVAAVASAESGQAELDEATDLKLSAKNLGDYDKVISLCESALKKELDDDAKKLAKQLLTATCFEVAQRMSRPILETRPPDPRWPLLRKQALTRLETALKYEPEFSPALYLLARLQSLPGGDRKRAREAIDKAVKLAGNDNKELSKALALRGNLAEDEDSKLADWNQAIIIDPANNDARRTRGMYFLAKRQFEKAAKDLVDLSDGGDKDILTHHALAEAYMAMEKLDEALEQLNKAAEIDDKSALTYSLRARIHGVKEDMKSARADIDKALELDSRHVPSLLMRARLLLTDDKVKEAKKDIDRALVIRPGLVEGLLLRSIVYADEGRFDSAASDMEKLLKANPKNVPWRLQLAAYQVADKRPRKAIEVLSTVIKDDPQNVSALRARADARLSIGKHPEAIKDFEDALAIEPENSGVLNNLAWVLATSPEDKLRNAKKSIELGKRACEVTEYKQAHILSTLAAGYAEAGDFKNAIKWSKKAIKLGKDSDVEGQLEKELKSYQEGKPWRELQQTTEKPEPAKSGGTFEL